MGLIRSVPMSHEMEAPRLARSFPSASLAPAWDFNGMRHRDATGGKSR